jgi:ADP-ribose pyrophosphatase YjhB (NUDIX family)
MHWEQFAMKVLSICKIGIKYSKDPYAIENYKELQDLSVDMLNSLNIYPIKDNFYERDIYPTPNLSVRVIVLNKQNQILMVKEVMDGKWAIPGGWVDVFDAPSQAATNEIKQEAGIDVRLVRLLAVMQRERYKDYPTLVSEMVHYFLAVHENGDLQTSHETSEVAWFDIERLPELSKKTTKIEIERALDVALNNKDTYFD